MHKVWGERRNKDSLQKGETLTGPGGGTHLGRSGNGRETSLAKVSHVEVSGVEARGGLAEEFELDPKAEQGHQNEMEGISCLRKEIM